MAASSSTTGLAPNVVGLTSPIVRLENRHFPNFYVENLQSGTAFGMVVYAQNSKVSPFSTINQFIRNDPNIGHLQFRAKVRSK